MKIERIGLYKPDIPIAYFISADFKSRSKFFKRLDTKYDIRRKLKAKYRYYHDIYSFNKYKGDCLKLNYKDQKLYGLVVHEQMNSPIFDDNLNEAFSKLKDYIFEEGITEIQINCEGLEPYFDTFDLLDYIGDWFILLPGTVYILGGNYD